jgi:hypothetical protein
MKNDDFSMDLWNRFYAEADRLCDEDGNYLERVDLDWYLTHLNESNYDEMLDEVRADAAFCM